MHNVVINHRHADDALIGKMKDLFANHGADVQDSSVTITKPNSYNSDVHIKSHFADLIRRAEQMLILVSRPYMAAFSIQVPRFMRPLSLFQAYRV